MDERIGSPIDPARPLGPVEIRVHGVGSHSLWSALGSPPILRRGRVRDVTLALPPEKTEHDLVLVNWSRMSRRAPALLWYLALPYTLMNLANAMRPNSKGRRLVHVFLLVLFSIILTVLTTSWLIALFQTLLTLVRVPAEMHGFRRPAAAVAGVLAIAAPMLIRSYHHKESDSHRPYALMHTAIAVSVGAAAYVVRPTEWRVPDYSVARFFAVVGPSDKELFSTTFDPENPGNLFYYFDPIAAISYGSLVLSLVLAAALLATASRGKAGPAAAAAFSVILAGALTNLVLSSTHFGLTKLVAGLSRPENTFGIGWDFARPTDAVILGRFGRSYPTTLIAGCALLLLVLIVAITLLQLAGRGMLSWAPLRRHSKRDFLTWSHGAVERLPKVLPWVLTFVIIWALVVAFGLRNIFTAKDWYDAGCGSPFARHPGDCLPLWLRAIPFVAAGASFVGFYLIRKVNSAGALRNTVAAIADVSGFWPITLHPLGARTYRDEASDGILRALKIVDTADRVVLAGHSQGSVLVAWTVFELSQGRDLPKADLRHDEKQFDPSHGDEVGDADLGQDQQQDEPSDDAEVGLDVAAVEQGEAEHPAPPLFPELALVTCGSPLRSLYATFFPGTFDDQFFEDVRASVADWGNFWRETDPIATNFCAGPARTEPIPDPPQEETKGQPFLNARPLTAVEAGVRGHGDYWIANEQKKWIRTFLEPPAAD